MMKLNHEFNNLRFKYSTTELWKNIISNEMILKHSKLYIKDSKGYIYVDDNSIATALEMGKDTILNKLKEQSKKITEVKVILTKKELNSPKPKTKEEKMIGEKIINDLKNEALDKYKDEKNENLKNILIFSYVKRGITEYLAKKNGDKKCAFCNGYFKGYGKSNECVLCENKRKNKEIIRVRAMIEKDPELTPEYVNKVLGFEREVYERAFDSLLDEMYLRILANLKNGEWPESLIEEYSMYFIRSRDKQVIKLFINQKLNRRLKKYMELKGKK